MKRLTPGTRARLARAAEAGLLAYLLMAGPVWMVAAIVVLALAVVGLAVALAATRVRLREITDHDRRQYLTIQRAGLSTAFQAGPDDDQARAHLGRRP